MIGSVRRLSLALGLAGSLLAVGSPAADLEALMKEFRVAPSELKPAPAFSLKALDGKVTALADHRGRPVLLYFWATW